MALPCVSLNCSCWSLLVCCIKEQNKRWRGIAQQACLLAKLHIAQDNPTYNRTFSTTGKYSRALSTEHSIQHTADVMQLTSANSINALYPWATRVLTEDKTFSLACFTYRNNCFKHFLNQQKLNNIICTVYIYKFLVGDC